MMTTQIEHEMQILELNIKLKKANEKIETIQLASTKLVDAMNELVESITNGYTYERDETVRATQEG